MNTPPRIPRSRWFLFAAIAAAALISDLWSKQAVFAELGYPGSTDWTRAWFDGWRTKDAAAIERMMGLTMSMSRTMGP